MTTTASAKTPPDSRQALVGWFLTLSALSVLVARGYLVPLDRQIAGWVAALRSPEFDGLMRAITWFGGGTWNVLGLLGLGWLVWRRGRLASAFLLYATFLVGGSMEILLRLWVSQWRPDAGAIRGSLDPITHFGLTGFPSGHAFRSAFIFGWLVVEARGWPRAGGWRALGLVMIALVGFTRVYLNRHWASDVVGAWLIVLTTFALARCWEQRASR